MFGLMLPPVILDKGFQLQTIEILHDPCYPDEINNDKNE